MQERRTAIDPEIIKASDILFWSFFFSQFNNNLQQDIFWALKYYHNQLPVIKDWDKVISFTTQRAVNHIRSQKHAVTEGREGGPTTELLLSKVPADMVKVAEEMRSIFTSGRVNEEHRDQLFVDIIDRMTLQDFKFVISRKGRPGRRRAIDGGYGGRRQIQFIDYVILGKKVPTQRSVVVQQLFDDLRVFYYQNVRFFKPILRTRI